MTIKNEKSILRQRKYRKTELGIATTIWHHMKRNISVRDHEKISFSKIELLNWMKNQKNFEKIITKWRESNYEIMLKPSVDRKDNSRSYIFENMQLVTWKENLENSHRDVRKNTLKNSGLLHQHNPCVMYSSDGKKIGEFISISDAAREINTTANVISSCCLKKRISHKGFLFCYLSDQKDFEENNLKEYVKKYSKTKDFAGIKLKIKNIDTNEEFEANSISESIKITGLSHPTILKLILNKKTRFEKKFKINKI